MPPRASGYQLGQPCSRAKPMRKCAPVVWREFSATISCAVSTPLLPASVLPLRLSPLWPRASPLLLVPLSLQGTCPVSPTLSPIAALSMGQCPLVSSPHSADGAVAVNQPC